MLQLKSSLHLFPKASSVLVVPFIFVPLHVCVLQVDVGFFKEIYFCLKTSIKQRNEVECPVHRPKVGDRKFLSYIQ